MNEEERIHLTGLCEIYHRQLKEGVITDSERQMYQHCIAALQRVYKKGYETTQTQAC